MKTSNRTRSMDKMLRQALQTLKTERNVVFAELGSRVGYKTNRLAQIVDNPDERMLKTKHKHLVALLFPMRTAERKFLSDRAMALELCIDPYSDNSDQLFGEGVLGYGDKHPISGSQRSQLHQLHGHLVKRRERGLVPDSRG